MVGTVGVSLADRARAVVGSWRVIVRLSVAPALAWWVSMQIFEHNQAFFAPIAAVLTLTVGSGERLSIVVEIVIGAAFGILVGELLVLSIGRGTWQLLLVVALAVVSARFIGLPGLAITQAVVSGVLLVAVVPLPGMTDPALARFADALIGGLIGLGMIIVLPANPVREMDRAIQGLREELAGILDKLAQALRDQDAGLAAEALSRARSTQPLVDTVGALADSAGEMARLSPFRWRQRGEMAQRDSALIELDHAVRNTRVLSRRTAAMLRHREPVPPGLADSVAELARLARTDAENVSALIEVARSAIAAASTDLTINTAALASQIRAIVADMMLAAGTPYDDLDRVLDF